MTGALDGDALAADLVVTVSIVNASGQGKATTGMDFETVENFTLTPVDDIFDETVVIGGSARGLAGTNTEVTITNNDPPGYPITVDAPQAVDEDAGTVTDFVSRPVIHQKNRNEYPTLTPRPTSGAKSLMNDMWFR